MTTQEKKKLIRKLWKDLSNNTKVTKRYKIREGKKVNVGFVNQYALHSFIPNKWFDWENRVNAEIMIIGQEKLYIIVVSSFDIFHLILENTSFMDQKMKIVETILPTA